MTMMMTMMMTEVHFKSCHKKRGVVAMKQKKANNQREIKRKSGDNTFATIRPRFGPIQEVEV